MPSHKNARRRASLGVSPHPHSGALPDLPRTRGCPRVSPVAIDRRSCGTRNRRLTAHERMYHLAECQMILCNPSRLWRAGYKPRRMAGCSRRDDSHGWNPWDTTYAYPPRNAPAWGCGLTPRVAALMPSLAPIIAYQSLSHRSPQGVGGSPFFQISLGRGSRILNPKSPILNSRMSFCVAAYGRYFSTFSHTVSTEIWSIVESETRLMD